ncbi:MAG: TorF family putative porin, partial [Gammaproteobacteria bacterium]
MKKTLLSLSIAAAAVSVPAQAADIGGGFDLSGNMALTSNYIWRGVSQSDDDPAIQGGLDLAHESGVYAGVWASNVESE